MYVHILRIYITQNMAQNTLKFSISKENFEEAE